MPHEVPSQNSSQCAKSGTVCHTKGETEAASTAKHCLECHKETTDWATEYDESDTLTWAVGYMEAMHKNCMECHKKEAEEANRPELPDCSICHRSLTPRIVDSATVALGARRPRSRIP